MSNESAPPKNSRTPWIIAGALGCLALCLCIAIVVFAFYAVGQSPSSVATTQPTQSLLQPPATGSTANIVTGAVTARDVQGDNFDPVGITDVFPADQKIFHTVVTISNAPANTVLRAVWLSSDNVRMGEFEVKTDGSRNVDFTFKPDAGQLPAGNYHVEIYVNGKLDRPLRFVVSAAAQTQPTSAPTQETCPSATPKSSGYINDVVIAEGTQGADKQPANPTTTFKPSAVFHAIVRTQNAPANTNFKATWCLTDVGSASAPNSLIDSTDLATDGSRNIDFTLKPTSTWPVGSYRVLISVNGVVDTIKNFSVK